MNVFEELAQIQIEFQKDLKLALGLEQLDYLKIKYMGRSGIVTNLLRKISSVQKEDRPKFGAEANKLKSEISDLISQKIEAVQDSGDSKTVYYLDVTLPGRARDSGTLHLLPQQ